MTGETITELIVNLKDEIQKYAATKNHTHLDLNNAINELRNKFNQYWVKEGDDGILAYLNGNYYLDKLNIVKNTINNINTIQPFIFSCLVALSDAPIAIVDKYPPIKPPM